MQLTIREVAKLLDVPESAVYRWLDSGELPAFRIEDDVRFNRSELLEWATLRRLPVSGGLLKEPARGDSFREALEAGKVHYGLEAGDAPSALRAVAAALEIPPEDKKLLLDMLLAQGERALTPVGEGVAIPHVRHPAVASIPRPLASLHFLSKPLNVKGPDGRPVDALFFLVTPSPRAHLRLLSRLAAALHDTGFKAALARRAAPEELLRELGRLEGGA